MKTETDDTLKKGFEVRLAFSCRQSKGLSFLLKSIVKGALNTFLCNTEDGPKEETKYFIYMHDNAVVRLDVKVSKSTIILLDLAWCLAVYCSFSGITFQEMCASLTFYCLTRR